MKTAHQWIVDLAQVRFLLTSDVERIQADALRHAANEVRKLTLGLNLAASRMLDQQAERLEKP